MRRRIAATAIVVGLVSIPLFAPGTAGAKKTKLQADLSGAAEVPGPGDPDGTGSAVLQLKEKPGKKNGKICFLITYQNLGSVVGGHIHEGGPTTDGPIVVPLFETPTAEGVIDDCVKQKRNVVKKIAHKPGDFYVNLHSTEFPGGAIRGQMRVAP